MPTPIPVKTGTDGSRFIVIKEECSACSGTGVIKDPRQPQDTVFVCTECQGLGGYLRKITLCCGGLITRNDVKFVRLNSFSMARITYAQFLKGDRP